MNWWKNFLCSYERWKNCLCSPTAWLQKGGSKNTVIQTGCYCRLYFSCLVWISWKVDAGVKCYLPLSGCICHHSLGIARQMPHCWWKHRSSTLGEHGIPLLCRLCSSQGAVNAWRQLCWHWSQAPLFVFDCIPCLLLLTEVEGKNLRRSCPDVSNLF